MDKFPENFRAVSENSLDFIRAAIMRDYEDEGLPVYYRCANHNINEPNIKELLEKDHEKLLTIKAELEERGFVCELEIETDSAGVSRRGWTDRWTISISNPN